jgi:hypothetical protein
MNGEQQICWTGAELRYLMRVHKVTIRELSARLGITMKRIRLRRTRGLADFHAVRDWVQAITWQDPGDLRSYAGRLDQMNAMIRALATKEP